MVFLLTQTQCGCMIRKNVRCSISIGEERMAEVQRCVSGEYDGVRRNVCASGDSRAPPFPQALCAGSERLVPQKGFRPHVGASREDGSCPCASCRQHKGIVRATRCGFRTDVDHHLMGQPSTIVSVRSVREVPTGMVAMGSIPATDRRVPRRPPRAQRFVWHAVAHQPRRWSAAGRQLRARR